MARVFLPRPVPGTQHKVPTNASGAFVEAGAALLGQIGRDMAVAQARTEARVPSPTSRAYTFYAALSGRALAQDGEPDQAAVAAMAGRGRSHLQARARASFRGLCAVFALREALGLEVALDHIPLSADTTAPAISRALVAAFSGAPGGAEFWQTLRLLTVRSRFGDGEAEVLGGLSPLTAIFPAASPPRHALGGVYWYEPAQPRREGTPGSYAEPVWYDPTSSTLSGDDDEFLLSHATRDTMRGALRAWVDAALRVTPPGSLGGLGLSATHERVLRDEFEAWQRELKGARIPDGLEVTEGEVGGHGTDLPMFLRVVTRGVPAHLLSDLPTHNGRLVVTADGLTSRTTRIWGRRYGDDRLERLADDLPAQGDNLGDALGLGPDALPAAFVSIDGLFTPRLTLLTRDQVASAEWRALQFEGGRGAALFPFHPDVLTLLWDDASAETDAGRRRNAIADLVGRASARQSDQTYVVSLELGGQRVERPYSFTAENAAVDNGLLLDDLIDVDSIDLRLFPDFDLEPVADRLPVVDGKRPDGWYFARLRRAPGWEFSVDPFRLSDAAITMAGHADPFVGRSVIRGEDRVGTPAGARPPGQAEYFVMENRPDGFFFADRGFCLIDLPGPDGGNQTAWKVGVDFGTSNTCVAYDDGTGAHTLDLPIFTTTLIPRPVFGIVTGEDRSGTLLETNEGAAAAYDFFYRFNDDEAQLNLHTYYPTQVLTRERVPSPEDADGPGFDLGDGLIYFRNIDPGSTQLLELLRDTLDVEDRTEESAAEQFDLLQDIKWERREWLRHFMGHLRKQVVLTAAKRGGRIQSITFSHPRAFQSTEVTNYWSEVQKAWAGVLTTSRVQTFRTESEAVRSTLATGKNQRVVFDVGGGTTDLIGFRGHEAVFQASLKLAGRPINDYVVASPAFRRALVDLTEDALGSGTLGATKSVLVGERPRGEVITNAWVGLLQTLDDGKLDEVVVNLTNLSDGPEGRAVKGFFLSLSLLFGGLAFSAGRLHRAASEGKVVGVAPFPLELTRLTLTGNGSKLYRLLSPDGYSFDPVFERLFRAGLQRPVSSIEQDPDASGRADRAASTQLKMEGIYREEGGGAELAKATVALGLVKGVSGNKDAPVLPVPDFLGEDLPGVEGGALSPAGRFYADFARDDRSFPTPHEAPPELAAFLDTMGEALPRGKNRGHTVIPGLGNDWSGWARADLYPKAAPYVRDRVGEIVGAKNFDVAALEDRPRPGDGEYPMLEPLFIAEVAALLQLIRDDYAR